MYSVAVKQADWIKPYVWNVATVAFAIPAILKVFPNNRHLQIDSACWQLLDRKKCRAKKNDTTIVSKCATKVAGR
jgi:hypothetical protein